MAKKKTKKKTKANKIILFISSIILGIFFILWGKVHIYLAEMMPHLHFCSYLACVVFSLIWLVFMGITIFFLTGKRKKIKISKIWYVPVIAILIIGIILMNLTYCDAKGEMHFGLSNVWRSLFGMTLSQSMCKPGETCCEHDCPVPLPPCLETDNGRDYISYGEITSGVFIDDICLENGELRERYCNSDLTYTSEDIDCAVQYGTGWLCIEGECRYSSTPTPPPGTEDTLTLCSDGIDNDGDGDIDCDDLDCAEFCACVHGEAVTYPTCGGVCPSGSYCAPYNRESGGWCECVPNEETACGSAKIGGGIYCEGWCLDGDYCISDGARCYCSDFPCIDLDGGYFAEIEGICIDEYGVYGDYCLSDTGVMEYTCGESGCVENQIDCIPYAGGSGVCVLGDLSDYCGDGLE